MFEAGGSDSGSLETKGSARHRVSGSEVLGQKAPKPILPTSPCPQFPLVWLRLWTLLVVTPLMKLVPLICQATGFIF